MESRFDFLTGVVHIDADAPEGWRDEAVLPVWAHLNDPSHGDRLPRLLIHESAHFWQLLGSGYMARLIADEWGRLMAFEDTGTVPPKSERVAAYTSRTASPFAASELVEAWCRYWDVHIRGPLQVMLEERLERPEGPTRTGAYSHHDFDAVMTHGPLEQQYARPYRWLLEESGGDSMLCNTIFPFTVFSAFLSDDPASFFREAVQRLLDSEAVARIRRSATEHGHVINLIWLSIAEVVLQQHLGPLLVERSVREGPPATGMDVLAESALAQHPLLGPYAVKGAKSNFSVWAATFYPDDPEEGPNYSAELSRLAREAPVLSQLCMPGQPWYRLTLGAIVPPPVIRFRTTTWAAPLILDIGITPGMHDVVYRARDGKTFAPLVEEAERRARNFRFAEEESDFGLPIGTLPR